jgi:hypothetical protein
MGKRSNFPRIPKDLYETPESAVLPLLGHLEGATRFIEPCLGNGVLASHLKRAGHVLVGAHDLPTDARLHRYEVSGADCFIANPPGWGKLTRTVLHPIIRNLSDQLPTWLLMNADWVHNKAAAPFMPRLRTIVSVGRVKFIPDSPHVGMENCCWLLFDRPDASAAIHFFGRLEDLPFGRAIRFGRGGGDVIRMKSEGRTDSGAS